MLALCMLRFQIDAKIPIRIQNLITVSEAAIKSIINHFIT